MVLQKLEHLTEDPHPPGSCKLQGVPEPHGLYRVRAGDYLIVYAIRGEAAVVLVVKVADRKEVYKRISELRRLLE